MRIGTAPLSVLPILYFALALEAAGPITIPEGEAKKAAVKKPAPTLSAMARQLNVSGHVTVEVEIDEDGKVATVKPATGSPLLSSGVVTAVKEWKFTPFTQDGVPAKAVTTLSFDFKQ